MLRRALLQSLPRRGLANGLASQQAKASTFQSGGRLERNSKRWFYATAGVAFVLGVGSLAKVLC